MRKICDNCDNRIRKKSHRRRACLFADCTRSGSTARGFAPNTPSNASMSV